MNTMNILHIHASPRVGASHSHKLVQALFDKLEARGKTVQRDTLNLWTENLPAVDERFLEIKTKAAKGDELTNSDQDSRRYRFEHPDVEFRVPLHRQAVHRCGDSIRVSLHNQ